MNEPPAASTHPNQSGAHYPGMRIVVLLPCYNEILTVGKVVADFRASLPDAEIHVVDNNSTDGTADAARTAGATVTHERRQGKGYVVASMLEKIDADIYLMVDSDDTYPAEVAPQLVGPIVAGDADMVVGRRIAVDPEASYRRFHRTGNRIVTSMVNSVFSSSIQDVMSGYRAFTRELAESVPVVAGGFDVETEFTLASLYRQFRIIEVDCSYRERPPGSHSKLDTFSDGRRVIARILAIYSAYKPLTFFGSLGALCFAASLISGYAPIYEYVTTQIVLSIPRAILATGLVLLGGTSVGIGVIIHTLNFRLLELDRALSKRTAHLRLMMQRTSQEKSE